MATLGTANGQFEQSFTIAKKTGTTVTMATEGKYVDKNIKLTLNVQAGAAEGGSASVAKVATDGSAEGVNITAVIGSPVTSEPTSGYYAAFTGTGNSKVTTAGWFDTGNLASKTSATTYFPVTAGSCTVAGGVLSTSGYTKSNLALTLQSGSDTNMVNVTTSTSQTLSGYDYHFKINGSTPAVSGTTSASVTAITDTHTAGYIPAKATTNFRNAQSASPAVSVNATSGSIWVQLKKATFTYAGGGLTGQGATAAFVNSNNKVISVTSTDSYNNGLSIQAKGTAGRAAVTYTSTAGYFPTLSDATTASGAVSASTWNGTTYYLTGVKIAAPSSGVAKFDIIVPNGSTSDFITFQFQVDSSGNVTILGPD